MTQSLFAENVVTHAARLQVSLRQTRLWRQALTVKHAGGNVAQINMSYTWEMVEAPVAQCALRLGVVWDEVERKYRPGALSAPPNIDPLYTMPVPDRRQRARAGQAVNHPPYLFVGEPPALAAQWLTVVLETLEVAATDGYTVAADYLNHKGCPTASGRAWDKSTLRAWLQNPYLAGYIRICTKSNADGSTDKRGPWRLYPGQHRPLCSLQRWAEVNAKFLVVYAAKITFQGFLSTEDEQAWAEAARLAAQRAWNKEHP